MNNTQLRLASAAVMIAGLLLTIYLGQKALTILSILLFLFVQDEFFVNFLKKQRKSLSYLLINSSLAGLLSYYTLWNEYISIHLNYLSCFFAMLLLTYLCFSSIESTRIKNTIKNYPILFSTINCFLFYSLCSIIQHAKWTSFVFIYIFLTFLVDSGAWFWGKKFGKTKLAPSVSPNKTVEGFIGGVLTSVIVVLLLWSAIVGPLDIFIIFSLIILACCAQLGDLIQSKLKRQFEIKDSSRMIPGHGGIYDRIDSLLFLAPFFAVLIYLKG